MLVANGLLSNETVGIFKTTSKGLQFLDTTRQMDGMFQIGTSTEKMTVLT